MKVTVTGATGFLGARVIEKLVSRGYSVKGTYHSRSKKILEEKNVKPVYMDLNEPSTFHEVVKDSDVIIHLAAYYTFTGKKKLYYKLNVEATKILAELALKQGISRFIYCSSTEAIGPVENPPGNEDTPPKPQFEYGRSKLLAEREVEKLGLQGLSYTIIRPSGLYGPGNIDDVSYWFITSFANRSLLSKFKIGRGDTLIQFSHVDDAAEGFILALDKLDESENQTFIVSEDKAYTYNEVYQILSDITGNPPPRYSLSPRVSKLFLSFTHLYSLLSGTSNLLMRVSIVDSVTRHRAYSIEKAKRLLGFSPRYNLRKGLEETIMWYKSKGYIK